jgi:hypothetical protein
MSEGSRVDGVFVATMQEMVSIAPGVMPTAAPDLGGGNIASFVLSAYGITGQSTALIEGIT